MNDENQVPVPDPVPSQEVVSLSDTTLEQQHSSKSRRGALESLPKEVKDDMEAFMRSKNPHAAKKYMAEKYGEKFPVLKDISKMSFRQYAKRHNVMIAKELSLQLESAPPPPEILDVINKITDPSISLQDKRLALTALFNACESRSKMLQERQTNFIDPALEALILANRKEQRIIIEKVAVLNDQLTKESDKDWLSEAEMLMQVMLSSVVTSYKITHQDQTQFSMFISTLSENLTQLLKSYTATKERLKKEPS